MNLSLRPLLESVEGAAKRAVEIRHDLHAHPEMGYEEHYTSRLVQRELQRLSVPFTAGWAGTGVVALIEGTAKEGRGGCVMLRADMDALPITEETGLPYASQTPGMMHACGHDGHTATLLGVAEVLQGLRGQFRGTIKLLFQPAEEGGCGGEKVVAAGVLENPPVEAAFALHGWPWLKVGQVGSRPGPLLASMDGFTIKLRGKGAHAATPNLAIDPVICGAAIVQALQAVVAREGDPLEGSVLTVAAFHAGKNFNVIPETAELKGTIRALSAGRRKEALAALERVVRGVAGAYRCGVEIEYYATAPVTVNTPAMVDLVRATAEEVLGTGSYVGAEKPTMGSEDFAFILERVPGCYFVVGVCPADRATYPGLHTPQFDYADGAVGVGIRILAGCGLRWLGR